jgi:Protein of unknown function (DUF3237)
VDTSPPRLAGEMLANGADWHTRGIHRGPPDVGARIGQRRDLDRAHYYVRVRMALETASATYGRLNRLVAVAVGSALRLADAVVYDAYLVT